MGNALVANLLPPTAGHGRAGLVQRGRHPSCCTDGTGRVTGAVVAHGVASCGSGPAAEWCSPAAASLPARSCGRGTCPAPPRSSPAPEKDPPATRSRWRSPSVVRSASPATTTPCGSPARSAAARTAPRPSFRTSGTGRNPASSRSTRPAGGSSTNRCPTTGSPEPCTSRIRRADHPGLAGGRLPHAGPIRAGHVRPHLPEAVLRKHLRVRILAHRAHASVSWPPRIGVDPDGLEQTVADNNRFARTGVDEQFGKGESAVRPSSTATPTTDRTSTWARSRSRRTTPSPSSRPRWAPRSAYAPTRRAGAQRRPGNPMPGLYACGNDARLDHGVGVPRGRMPGRRRHDLRLSRRPACRREQDWLDMKRVVRPRRPRLSLQVIGVSAPHRRPSRARRCAVSDLREHDRRRAARNQPRVRPAAEPTTTGASSSGGGPSIRSATTQVMLSGPPPSLASSMSRATAASGSTSELSTSWIS